MPIERLEWPDVIPVEIMGYKVALTRVPVTTEWSHPNRWVCGNISLVYEYGRWETEASNIVHYDDSNPGGRDDCPTAAIRSLEECLIDLIRRATLPGLAAHEIKEGN
jgi:hypothetical protein